MPKIFISYRRDDSSGHAGRLSDHLRQHFGDDSIFMDVDTIDLGHDFQTILQAEVNKCDIMLVVIGREWLDCIDPQTGVRRLDNPKDWIRIETVEALRRDIPVVPVLVDGAELPVVGQLPQNMSTLPNRQAATISDNQWRVGVDNLITRLEAIPRRKEHDETVAWLARIGPKRLAAFAAGIMAILAVIAWLLWPARVQVPAVTGKSLAQAREEFVAVGLALPSTSVKEEESLTQPPGTVIRQEPSAGLHVSKGEPAMLVVAKVPPPVDLSVHVKIRNTGQEGAVAALAAITAIEVAFSQTGNNARYSERYLYEKAKRHDETGGGDGTWMTAIVYAAEQFGVPPYGLWPFESNEHSLPHGVTWKQLDEAASSYKTKFHRIDHVEGIYEQLRRGWPVVAGVNMGGEWDTKDAIKTGRIEITKETHLVGLSAVTFVGFNPSTKELRFANTWGETWGDKGFGTMTITTAHSLVDAESMWAVEAATQK